MNDAFTHIGSVFDRAALGGEERSRRSPVLDSIDRRADCLVKLIELVDLRGGAERFDGEPIELVWAAFPSPTNVGDGPG